LAGTRAPCKRKVRGEKKKTDLRSTRSLSRRKDTGGRHKKKTPAGEKKVGPSRNNEAKVAVRDEEVSKGLPIKTYLTSAKK